MEVKGVLWDAKREEMTDHGEVHLRAQKKITKEVFEGGEEGKKGRKQDVSVL